MLDGRAYYGEVVTLYSHEQHATPLPEPISIFAEVAYMVAAPPDASPVAGNPWGPYPELDVRFWEYNVHQDHRSPSTPPSVIPASAIQCQLARGTCRITGKAMWMTTTLDRQGISMAPSEDEP
ncbi:hypothetical protein FKP32DRAFT_1578410 [Trametes sanguinea]|nr:hypothetical protein FKP32DRAFT_1578410 [Trametes sanguinea]